jgi:hypothetical protein
MYKKTIFGKKKIEGLQGGCHGESCPNHEAETKPKREHDGGSFFYKKNEKKLTGLSFGHTDGPTVGQVLQTSIFFVLYILPKYPTLLFVPEDFLPVDLTRDFGHIQNLQEIFEISVPRDFGHSQFLTLKIDQLEICNVSKISWLCWRTLCHEILDTFNF